MSFVKYNFWDLSWGKQHQVSINLDMDLSCVLRGCQLAQRGILDEHGSFSANSLKNWVSITDRQLRCSCQTVSYASRSL